MGISVQFLTGSSGSNAYLWPSSQFALEIPASLVKLPREVAIRKQYLTIMNNYREVVTATHWRRKRLEWNVSNDFRSRVCKQKTITDIVNKESCYFCYICSMPKTWLLSNMLLCLVQRSWHTGSLLKQWNYNYITQRTWLNPKYSNDSIRLMTAYD